MEWKETKALIDTFSYALRVMHYGWSKSRYKCFEAFDEAGQLEERILQTDQLKNAAKHLQHRVDHTLCKSLCSPLYAGGDFFLVSSLFANAREKTHLGQPCVLF